MGFIQGVAEFLPVSSSGHLALGKFVLGLDTEVDMLFDVMLHIGTLIAVFIAFRDDIKELIVEGFSIIRDLFVNLYIAISPFSTKNSYIQEISVIDSEDNSTEKLDNNISKEKIKAPDMR